MTTKKKKRSNKKKSPLVDIKSSSGGINNPLVAHVFTSFGSGSDQSTDSNPFAHSKNIYTTGNTESFRIRIAKRMDFVNHSIKNEHTEIEVLEQTITNTRKKIETHKENIRTLVKKRDLISADWNNQAEVLP